MLFLSFFGGGGEKKCEFWHSKLASVEVNLPSQVIVQVQYIDVPDCANVFFVIKSYSDSTG